MYRWLWTSAVDAIAINKNWMNSLSERRMNPSAMFAIEDVAAAWICPDSRRSFLNAPSFVTAYTLLTSFLASCQHSRSSKRVIFIDMVDLVYFVHFVCLVCLVYFVDLVDFVHLVYLVRGGLIFRLFLYNVTNEPFISVFYFSKVTSL